MQEKPGTLLLFDGHNVCLRAYHALGKQNLQNDDGVGTWGVYGAFKTIIHFVNEHYPSDVVVAFDWGRSEKRLELIPDYKANRNSSSPEHAEKYRESRKQIELLIRLLEVFKIPTIREPNVEADDIIAKVAKNYTGKIVIISADHDLRQLVDKNTVVIKPSIGTTDKDIYDLERIQGYYGVEPNRLPEIWSLTGDTSDNIKGVPGIGEKTAISLIQKYGDLSKLMMSDEKKVQGYEEVVRTAYKAINLDGSFANVVVSNTKFEPIEPGTEGADAVLSILEELGFNSIKFKWITGTLWKGNKSSIGRSLN